MDQRNNALSDKVLIILPAFNRPEYIKHAIQSIIDQSHGNWLLVVSDNSTNEDVFSVVKHFDLDNVFYRRSGHGISPLDHARIFWRIMDDYEYDFVTIMHDDDIMWPNHIKSSVECLRQYAVGMVSSPAAIINEKGDKTGEIYDNNWLQGRRLCGLSGLLQTGRKNCFISPTIVFTKEAAVDFDIFLSSAEGYSDFSTNIVTTYNHGSLIKNEITFSYRLHSGQDNLNYRNRMLSLSAIAREAAISHVIQNNLTRLITVSYFRLLDALYKVYISTLK